MRSVIALVLASALLYAAIDLFWPLQRNLRQFDAAAVGALETKMWRSYYDREPMALFLEVAHGLRTQFRFPWLRSYLGAYHAAAAAFSFKDGKQRDDYQKALPALRAYFATLRNTGNIDFDVHRVAALELEWWIVHRERTRYPAGTLARACAEAAAALYRVSPESTLEHGRLRADAMVMRDTRSEAGSVTEADWAQIESLLRASYLSLRRAIS